MMAGDQAIAFHQTIKAGQIHHVRSRLEQQGTPVNVQDRCSALMVAARNGCYDLAFHLLQNKAQTDLQHIYGATALMLAAENGHEDVTQLLLQNNALTDIHDMSGTTALTVAAENDRLGVVRLLLKYNSSVDIKDENNKTPLMISAAKGHGKVIEVLLQQHADINMQDMAGRTALMCAAHHTHLDVVTQLLQHGAAIDMCCQTGWTALMFATAASHNDHLALKQLLHHEADTDMQTVDGTTALLIAASGGCHRALNLLLSYNASPDVQNNEGKTALMIAVAEGDFLTAQTLLQHRASINIQDLTGSTALLMAVTQRQHNIVQLILEQPGLLINLKTLIVLEAKRGGDNTVRLLMSYFTTDDHKQNIIKDVSSNSQLHSMLLNLNQDCISAIFKGGLEQIFSCCIFNDTTLLHYAVDRSDYRIAQLLLDGGVSPNTLNKENLTALFVSCVRDDIDMVQLIVKYGADVDIRGDDGISPITICVDKGHTEILKVLVHFSNKTTLSMAALCGNQTLLDALIVTGADVNQLFDKHQTALHIASHHGHSACVQSLLQHGANVHLVDMWQNTVLHEATYSGCKQTVQILLDHCPQLVNLTNINGSTAIHIAARHAHYECIQQLLAQADIAMSNDDNHMTCLDYFKLGTNLYHKDEEPCRDILGNMLAQRHPDEHTLSLLNQCWKDVSSASPMSPPTSSGLGDKKESNQVHPSPIPYLSAITFIESIRTVVEHTQWSYIRKLFRMPGCGMVSMIRPADKVNIIENSVIKLMRRLMKKMESLHIHLGSGRQPITLCVEVSGSTAEGTKVGFPDEFDCHICMDDLNECVTVTREREYSVNIDVNYENWDNSYSYLYNLLCQALTQRDIFANLSLCWKYIENEQIHFEWQGDHFSRMALKIDVVFVAKIHNWYPKQGLTHSPLLLKPAQKYGVCLLLRGSSWRPSSSTLEATVMDNIPSVPKTAYCFAKIINSLLKYDQKQLPYRVKTFDLKNALMYEVHKHMKYYEMTVESYYTSITEGSMMGDDDLYIGDKGKLENVEHDICDDDFLKKVCLWTHRICDIGLKGMLSQYDDKPYYFGFGRSRMQRAAVDRLLQYVQRVIGDINDDPDMW